MDRIIVMGASQGGLMALRTIVQGLPADLAAPVLVVQHIGDTSLLPSLLNDIGRLPARHATDGEPIQPGVIVVAPPGRHMLVVESHLELTHGPRENWSRPSLDPLFRSAAMVYGEAVVGVVLTGRLNDGTAGLYEIKRHGGVTIVQEPADCDAPAMPQSAIDHVPIDYRLPLDDIAACLTRLVDEARAASPSPACQASAEDAHYRLDARWVRQSCPECGGAMHQDDLGSIGRFRCHIGHVMTAEVLAAAQAIVLENQLASGLRLLKERAALCREIAKKSEARGDAALREAWLATAEQASSRADTLRALAESEWRHPETTLQDEAP